MKNKKTKLTSVSPSQPALYHNLDSWACTIRENLPHLSKPQATTLALWSLGLVLAGSCGLSAVALAVATSFSLKDNTARQRLREFYQEASAKRGRSRCQLDVTQSFAPLLGWLLNHWQSRQLALAMDATNLGQRFTVLAVSVVYRGCAIPVAWKVLSSLEKHPWEGEWLRLLQLLRPAIPAQMSVIVLADRGLYAKWLFEPIVRCGWHPFLRINSGGTFRRQGHHQFEPLRSLVPEAGCQWQAKGTAFKTPKAQLVCTLLARLEAGYKEPWLVVTDLEPGCADAAWYGLRSWIEQGFKDSKRGGFHWQRTRMKEPERAARLWLVLAVATLWLMSVGSEAEAESRGSLFAEEMAEVAQKAKKPVTKRRQVSLFRRGWQMILAALINQGRVMVGRFWPEVWPQSEREKVKIIGEQGELPNTYP